MERMASDSRFLGRMGIILRGWLLPRPVWLLKTVWSASLQFSDETAFCSLLYPQIHSKAPVCGKAVSAPANLTHLMCRYEIGSLLIA